MTFTILWPHGRALNVPAADLWISGPYPAPDSVTPVLPYRWRKAWERSAKAWWRDSSDAGKALYCVLYDRRNRPIVTLYATATP